jgi:uncharacterized membrane protein
MGSPVGTIGLSLLATGAFVAAAILSIIAADRLKSITGYNTNETFKAANTNLAVAITTGIIAAVLAAILLIGYIAHSVNILQTEWLHLILFVLGIASAIVSFIYLGMAMRKVDNTKNDNGTQTYLLWSMILTGGGLVLLVFMGMWRITHHATKTDTSKTDNTQYNYITEQPDDIKTNPPNSPAEQPMGV